MLLGTESLQTLGGSGFSADYPIEQYVRDAKIVSLYEGATAIQGLDFFFRKVVRDRGEALGYLSQQILATVKGGGDSDAFAAERELRGMTLTQFQSMVEFMVGRAMAADPRSGGDPRQVYAAGQHTTRLLLAAGDLLVGWLLLRHAEVAHAALDGDTSETDGDFYTGKIAAARFFTREVLPRLTSDATTIKSADLSLMDLTESAF